MKSHRRIVSLSRARERENAYCTRGNLLEHWKTSASHISYFTEGSAVFRGKCTENPDIQVIELDDSSKDSSESEIVALHLPDRRRREIIEVKNEERSNFCKNDDNCGSELICLAHLICRNEAHRAGNRSSLENTHNACQDAIPRYHPHCLSEPPSFLLRASSVTIDCGLTSAV
ncbi:hypothetical protein ALC60_14185 [Trachymyrmex zeteki]|uniref:Uncharacterized protein n=1 Tax=Mycetomoellerius zeteki TaxID=64791 RepID=A0A151WG49_9HYME|nr:hypothetical protein ALC60_14185 [Trachymyrmex zeteki]